jgi:DNA-binding transcriptional regulator YdaS (Cro superfamily)
VDANIEHLIKHFDGQARTAGALGVSQSAVSQWLSGKSRMGAVIALKAESITAGKFKAVELCPDLLRAAS